MAKSILKKEDEVTPAIEECVATKDYENDEDAFALLQILETEETRLSEQKEHLSSLFEQLQLKVNAEIENKKCKVQTLNSEVNDLKTKCEKFAKLINAGALPK